MIIKLCMYVGYHDANNVSNFGGDPLTQLHFKKTYSIIYAVLRTWRSIAAAGATQPRADCRSMEGHASLSTAQVLLIQLTILVFICFVACIPINLLVGNRTFKREQITSIRKIFYNYNNVSDGVVTPMLSSQHNHDL